MNPVVLIATHQRIEITFRNIKSILNQSIVPKIVLVCSDTKEAAFYGVEFPSIDVHITDNQPLGAKWQHGVNQARLLKPNPLIITGSDDLLGQNFVQHVCETIDRGYEFIGFQRWHVVNGKTCYLFDYTPKMPDFPLGARAYSKRMLEAIKYRLFDVVKDKHLDDHGWNRAKASGLKYLLTRASDMFPIYSIKGDWPVLNQFERMLNSPNCRLLKQWEFDESVIP